MTLYVLDTDHVSLFQRGHPIVLQHLSTVAPANLAVTIITVEEQMRGWLNVIRRAGSSDKITIAYASLHTALDYFKSVQVLDFDRIAYVSYQSLRQQKLRIGTQDLHIAAIVLSIDGILVTRNQRDFAQIPGLTLRNWAAP